MGLPIVQGEGATELAAFEKLWTDFMVANNVPAVALAVARNGRLLLSKSYTLGGGDPVALQLSPFRFGSCSKLITTIAIHQLLETVPGFTLESRASQILGKLPQPLKKTFFGSVPDENKPIRSLRWPDVTVQDLLTMKSGLRFNFADTDAEVCKTYLHPLPARNKQEIIRYNLTLFDQPGPGYRNFDFFILTAIIEKLTGMDYVGAVRKNLFEPLGLVRPRAAGSLAKDRAPNELLYHPADTSITTSVMTEGPVFVPVGQGDVNLETGVGVGGWLMTAPDFIKVLSIFDSGSVNRIFQNPTTVARMFGPPALGWSIGNSKTTSFEWGGILPGVRPYTSRRTDGVCIVSVFNTDTQAASNAWNPTLLTAMHTTLDGITKWPKPTYDLFESVGIPAASSNARWNAKPAVAEKGSGWSGWFDLGGRLGGPPAATRPRSGIYDVYARGVAGGGVGGRLWQKWWDGKMWQPSETGWFLHDDGDFRISNEPSVVSGEGFRDVYARAAGGVVFHKFWNGKEWSEWFNLGGDTPDAPAAVIVRAGVIDVYARGANGHLMQKWWDGTTWNPSVDGWVEHDDGNFKLTSDPAVIADGDNFRDVYVRGENLDVYHKLWDGEKWSKWFGLGGKIIGKPSVVFIPPNFVDVYAMGADGRLWQKWWDGSNWHPSPTEWLPHDDAGFKLTSSPSVISDGPHHRGVFARGPGNVLYYKFWRLQNFM